MIERISSAATSDCDYRSLVDVLRRRREETPDQLAFQFLEDGNQEGARLTYAQLARRSQVIASRLRKAVKRGDRALLLYPPGQEFLPAFFGCLQAGIIAIPLSPPDSSRIRRALPRLAAVAVDAEAALVLTTADIHDSLKNHLDEFPETRALRWVNTDETVEEDHGLGPDDVWQPSLADIAFLQYTSGSTSSPKGVMVSHGNVLAQCHALMSAAGYTPASVTATWMPYFHDYGLIEGLLMPLFVGAPCYFMSPLAFVKRPMRWLELISRYRVTHSQGPNFAYDLCVRKAVPEQLASLDLSCWVAAANGAEAVRPSTLRAFYETFKDCGLARRCISPAYGLAESTLVVSVTPPDEEPVLFLADTPAYERGRIEAATPGRSFRTLASSGRPLPGTRVEIVDPDTCRQRSPDEVGEIWLASPSVTQGYWKQGEATRHTFAARLADTGEGPFLRTGDLGFYKDEQLYITGRLKDLIIIRGLNHYPQDIELTVQRSHPALRAGCGAAFSVEVAGEEELVVVHDVEGKHQRNLDADEVFSAIRAAVFDEHDLRLHAIVLLRPGGVLKTTSGKIQRAAMKAAFAAGDLGSVARWDDAPVADHHVEPANGHSAASIRQWLITWLATKVGVAARNVDTSSKFSDCGLDSIRAAELAEDLEKWLHQRVDPTVFWNYPTIDALAESLAPTRPRAPQTRAGVSRSGTSGNGLDGTTTNAARRVADAGHAASAAGSIAIIGMGCRFPGGADSPERYWQLLRDGVDAISEIPGDRWRVEDYYDVDAAAPGKMYTRHGGFVEDVDGFDPAFFGITPREAVEMDPQQRLLLEVVWESLEHTGIPPSRLQGSETGVFIGLSSDDYAAARHNGVAELDAYGILGTARSIAAGRVAYVLGLHGPVVQLDTACSSSLVSVYQACQSLNAGECELALAGGVNLILSPETMVALCKLTALARDGRCKTFAAAADGYVRGEGCGIVVLKRLADAIRDGERILACIRGAAINHDGASNGLTAPNGQAQEQLIMKALKKARLAGREVSYVEAHGTGTELGDPVELRALSAVYGQDRPLAEPLYVGSAKTNIGHLEAAAGIAGLLKVVLMLQHREIPPHLNFDRPNPHFPWQHAPLRVPTSLQPWPDADLRGLAAVSSFGFSGTNAHVILEGGDSRLSVEKPRKLTSGAGAAPSVPLHLLPLSARCKQSLLALVQHYLEHLIAHPDQPLADVCFTAATARDHFPCRLAVVAASRDECLEKLRAFSSGDSSAAIVGSGRVNEDVTAHKVGFLFTGQGTQYAGMGSDLYESQPVFRAAIDRCRELLENHSEVLLTEVTRGGSSATDLLDPIENAQPALFSLQCALVELWSSWGVRPEIVLGHSLGEYAAACLAGVFDLETGIELVATRGRLMESLPRQGAMGVVMADQARVQAALEPFGEEVSIASINGPDTLVISGKSEVVREILARFAAAGAGTELLNTPYAGHSALIDPMLEPFAAAARKFEYSRPRINMISNVSGELAGEEVACARYWVQHLRSTVRFADGMRALAATGCRTLVEIGPNPNLLAMGMGCVERLRPRTHWLPSLTRDRSGWETMLYSLGKMYVHGADIDWVGFHGPYDRSRVSLPTYAFQRQSYQAARIERSASVLQSREKSFLPHPTVIAGQVDHLRAGLEDESRALTPSLDAIAVHFIIGAVTQLGFAWQVGATLSEATLHAWIPEQNRPKVARVFRRLVEAGWLKRVDGMYRVERAVPRGSAEVLLDALQQAASYPECDLLRRAGSSLARIWRGEAEPLSILFPDGDTDQAVTFYSQAKLLAGYNALASEVLAAALVSLPQSGKLRLLEVGAGTGGLTTHLLPRLPAGRCEYMFTDVSPLFLRVARDRFREFPFLQTALLDISQPPAEQGFELNSFDLVVAANVLHATPRLRDTLANVQQLLKPNGWLMLLEAANPPFWGDLVFTLIDGWWSFEDKELRPDYPLMRRDRWCQVLGETGFDEVACLNDATLQDDSGNTLYLAQVRSPRRGERASSTVSQHTPRDGRMPGAESLPGRMYPTAEDEKSDGVTLPATLIHSGGANEVSALVLSHAARVMRLNPAQIDPSQPLAELGLDSLMATELRSRLEGALGHKLSLNALQMRRSVEEIVAFVLEDCGIGDSPSQVTTSHLPGLNLDTPRVHLVPLQPKGKQAPLFFVPAGYGDLVAFQDISHAIGTDQPVYGLQPASAKQLKTFRQMSIYRLVSAYLSEIKAVQPTGPYLLSGYSAGGIIAVEVARELLRQGNEVALLVIFDPPSHVPLWLDWFYRVAYRGCQFTGLLAVANWAQARPLQRLFHAFLDEGLRTHTTVIREHRVAPYPGRITHFRPNLSQTSLVSLKPVGRFWRKIAQGGIEVHWIPGSHYGMLRGAGQGVVVDELHDCLQRAKGICVARETKRAGDEVR